MDIQTIPSFKAVSGDSVPGTISMSPGGVARNISENCSRLGLNCSLFSPYGDDNPGAVLLKETSLSGVNTNNCLCFEGEKSCSYSAFIDETGEMLYGVNEMSLMDRMTPELMISHKETLEQFDHMVIDANLPSQTIRFLQKTYSHKILLVDPVSAVKIVRLKNSINSIKTIKPNIIEAKEFSGLRIDDENDYYKVMQSFIDEGILSVFLSAGSQGIYYSDGKIRGRMPPVPVKIKSVTGAGDAASSALVLSVILNLNMIESAFLANLAAASSLLCSQSINKELSIPFLSNLCREYQYESELS
ncbi:hypothetical protein EXM22_05000 [Oceanispirochaeta crateris]|uniref:Carbohydrate kinase PfkB domain-containing protein n=2 Tax=Oceanispirochaeta crateris TaxID=2518645 RepID=A0A5C1QJA2_9SPIO|nr:hypothetical protein EXM22_05000 [Oceanispirochaeta crateris]